MNIVGSLIGGGIGAIIGAGIWAGVAYATHYEVGWIAVGVGALAGTGVRMGAAADGKAGTVGGILAAALAVLGIVAGKYLAIQWIVGGAFSPELMGIAAVADVVEAEWGTSMPVDPEKATSIRDFYEDRVWAEAERRFNLLPAEEQEAIIESPSRANPDLVLVRLADQVCEERNTAGIAIAWRRGMTYEQAWVRSHYPDDIWTETETRWNAMSAAEQESFRADVHATARAFDEAGKAEFDAVVESEGFLASFQMFDLIFGVIAIMTAFKIGCGPST